MKQGVKVGGAVDSTNQGAVEKLSESQIVRHCSPTLAGMKTGSIFSGGYDSPDELFGFLRRLNENLVPRGVRSVILRRSCQAALIYLYRPSQLTRDLTSPRAARMLGRYGYPLDCCDKCVVNLSSRLKTEPDFPHEIGLFLGYPPEDVEGFITHNAEDFKLSGMWKVYGDPAAAKKLFCKYKKCTAVYCRKFDSGSALERLTVKK